MKNEADEEQKNICKKKKTKQKITKKVLYSKLTRIFDWGLEKGATTGK